MCVSECQSTKQYKAATDHGPTCDGGNGCDTCWMVYVGKYGMLKYKEQRIARGIDKPEGKK